MKNEKVLKLVFTGLFAALSYVVFTFLQIKITLPGAAVDTDGYGYREVLDGYGRLSVRDKALIQSFIVTMLEK